MRVDIHELEKVHGTSNTQQERQPRHHIPIASTSYHESMCQLRQQICRPFHSAESRRQFMDQRHLRADGSHKTWALEEITQTYYDHVRLTHLSFPSPTIRESRHARGKAVEA